MRRLVELPRLSRRRLVGGFGLKTLVNIPLPLAKIALRITMSKYAKNRSYA